MPDKSKLARTVVSSPQNYYLLPAVIAGNWAHLKAAQGHPITPERMDRLHPNYGITRANAGTGPATNRSPLAEYLTDAKPRLSARIRARATELRRAV